MMCGAVQPEDIKPSFIRAIDSRTIHLRRLDVLVTGDGYNPSKQTTKDGRWKIEFVEKDGTLRLPPPSVQPQIVAKDSTQAPNTSSERGTHWPMNLGRA